MRGVNKVHLLGKLGADPEVRFMPSGAAVANLRLATNDGYKDKQTGQFIENTEWHRVVVFGKQAEVIGEYCKKGSNIYIEGRIRTTKWQDQQGQDRYTTEIVASEFQFIGGQSNNGQTNSQQPPAMAESSGNYAKTQSQPTTFYPDRLDDDEVPF